MSPATNSKLYATLKASGVYFSPMRFYKSWDRKDPGVTLQVTKGAQTVIQSGFVISGCGVSGHFIAKRVGKDRYPLEWPRQEYTFATGQVLVGKELRSRIDSLIKDNAQRLFNSELNYALFGKRK